MIDKAHKRKKHLIRSIRLGEKMGRLNIREEMKVEFSYVNNTNFSHFTHNNTNLRLFCNISKFAPKCLQ